MKFYSVLAFLVDSMAKPDRFCQVHLSGRSEFQPPDGRVSRADAFGASRLACYGCAANDSSVVPTDSGNRCPTKGLSDLNEARYRMTILRGSLLLGHR